MPPIFYLDDVVVLDGPVHYVLSFYASFCAIRALDIEAHLVGNPPVFRPVNPSPWALTQFNQLYVFFYGHLAEIIGAPNAHPQ